MWKAKVVFPSRLLIRTRRDFPFLLELNKLQRIGIFGGKNNISGETRPGCRQIASTSLAGSHTGLIPKQQSLKTPLKRWINTKAQWNTSNVSSLYTFYWTKVYVFRYSAFATLLFYFSYEISFLNATLAHSKVTFCVTQSVTPKGLKLVMWIWVACALSRYLRPSGYRSL